MKVAVDTNILIYAEGINDDGRQQAACRVMHSLDPALVVLPLQVLGELFRVLLRKSGRSPAEALAAVCLWRDGYAVAETSTIAFDAALELSLRHRLQIWDAVIIAVAAEAGCRLLISEDLQDGFTWAGLTIVNPFAQPVHPLLLAVLGRS